MRHVALVLLSAGIVVTACAPASDSPGTTTGDTTSAGDGGGGGLGVGGDDFGVGGAGASGGAGVGGECAEIPAATKNRIQPSDIILAVDQSGSMDTETNWVKNQLNGFAQQVSSSGIDVHVIVIAGKPGSENGFCIPAPLGSGDCPSDDNPPSFLHLPVHVDSHDALEKIISTYPQYKQTLRPDAAKHIIVISDDDSNLGSSSFDQQLKALDPTMFNEYHFHAIAVDDDDDCSEAEDEGKVYKQLVQMTGGIFGDLCEQDFQPVWDDVSTQVHDVAKIACEWEIPEPPDGEKLNPDLVNFAYTVDGGPELDLGRVSSAEECPTHSGGWYYDNAAHPQSIRVCPETCSVLQGADEATVTIKFGCATTPAPPA